MKSAKKILERGNTEGWGQLINISEKKNRFGLGYKLPMERDVHGLAKTDNLGFQVVFYRVGFIHDNQVTVIEYDTKDSETPRLVYRCDPDTTLHNWEATDLPKIFPSSK